MGINSFFTYTICLGAGVPWQQALGMVFVNGCVFLALSLSGVRERIIGAIPYSLKLAITCGIGLFIAFVGLRNGGVVVASAATFVTHGDFTSGPTALCLAGLALTIVLVARRVPGAIVLGMAVTTVVGLVVPERRGRHRHRLAGGAGVGARPRRRRCCCSSTSSFLTSAPAFFKALPLILTLLLVDMFDNIGTLIGVAKRAGLLDADGTLPRAGRVLVADSLAAILSALLGTSTVVSYIESASGVEAGGRTGLTTLTTAVCFLLALVPHAALPRRAGRRHRAGADRRRRVHAAVGRRDRHARLRDGGAGGAHAARPSRCTFSIAEGIGLGLHRGRRAGGRDRARPRGLPLVAYAIALVFFLQFFEIFPFNG